MEVRIGGSEYTARGGKTENGRESDMELVGTGVDFGNEDDEDLLANFEGIPRLTLHEKMDMVRESFKRPIAEMPIVPG